MNIGIRLATLRGAMSQAELGRLAGVDPGTISRLERGENQNPKMDLIERLATALGLTLAQFFAEDSAAVRKGIEARSPDPIPLIRLLQRQIDELREEVFHQHPPLRRSPTKPERKGGRSGKGASQ